MNSSVIDRVLKISIVALLGLLVLAVADAIRYDVVKVGDKAPNFSIRTDNGLTVSRTNFGGKLLVLNFWATWCPPCIDEIPSLNEFQERLKDAGVVVLGISVDEDEAVYTKFLRDHGVTFLTARDPGAEIPASYGTFRYPETYIINANGTVLQKIVGPTQWTDEGMIRYVRSFL